MKMIALKCPKMISQSIQGNNILMALAQYLQISMELQIREIIKLTNFTPNSSLTMSKKVTKTTH